MQPQPQSHQDNSFLDAVRRVCMRALKYMIEGMAVAIAAYYIPKRKLEMEEVITIAISAAAVFAVLDVLAPAIRDAESV